MTFRHIAVVVLSLVGSAVSRDCWGGLILQFSPNNTVTSINVNLNDTFNVDLYVAQDGGETRLTSAVLLSFGVRATYDTGC